MVDDTTIANTIRAKITEDKELAILKINTDLFNGNVTLLGVVPNKGVRKPPRGPCAERQGREVGDEQALFIINNYVVAVYLIIIGLLGNQMS